MERNIKARAVVTSVQALGDIHKSVSLFSPELGHIYAKIYGGRKGKKASLAPLFSAGDFQLYHNPVKNEYSITEEDIIFLPQNIGADIEATYTASYFCETVTRIKTDSPLEVYNLLVSALFALEQNPANHRKILIDYTWKLLNISGTVSDLTECPSCSKTLADDEVLYFSTSLMTPVCKNCSETDSVILLPGSRRYLIYTQNMSFEEALEVQLYETAQERLVQTLLRYINAFCRYPLKTISSGML
ncbi:MAG: DNA repair protein RecO [Sphaerochaetaceae bacterium]|nr:DNA repair protein RecO [Sphaerochaetaceae bacterium]